MLPDDELTLLLQSNTLAVSRCRRSFYRCIEQGKLYGLNQPQPFANPIPLYSRSSSQRGARFTAKGGPDTLYMAEDITTAYMEVDRAYRRVEGLEPSSVPRVAPPVVMFSITVKLERVLDLANPAVQSALQTDFSELTATWRLKQSRKQPIPTQSLGALVHASGQFQAIRYPSARDLRGCCLAVFPDRITPPSLIEVYDPYGELVGQLPTPNVP